MIPHWLTSSGGIGRKLVIYILLFSSAVSLAGTSLQLYLDYSTDVKSIHNNLLQVQSSHEASVRHLL